MKEGTVIKEQKKSDKGPWILSCCMFLVLVIVVPLICDSDWFNRYMNQHRVVNGISEMQATVLEAPKLLEQGVYAVKVEVFLRQEKKAFISAITTNPELKAEQTVKIRCHDMVNTAIPQTSFWIVAN